MMSIIGRKNAGKTTLLVALAAELVRRKFRVMTIKHGTHPADTDQRGKDSWRHWHEGHAERVLMEGPGQRDRVRFSLGLLPQHALTRPFHEHALGVAFVPVTPRVLAPLIGVGRMSAVLDGHHAELAARQLGR